MSSSKSDMMASVEDEGKDRDGGGGDALVMNVSFRAKDGET